MCACIEVLKVLCIAFEGIFTLLCIQMWIRNNNNLVLDNRLYVYYDLVLLTSILLGRTSMHFGCKNSYFVIKPLQKPV